MEKIGFIGLGNMGAPLAERLLKKHQLVVYDLDENNIKYFTDKGALACSNPAELASHTSRIFLCSNITGSGQNCLVAVRMQLQTACRFPRATSLVGKGGE